MNIWKTWPNLWNLMCDQMNPKSVLGVPTQFQGLGAYYLNGSYASLNAFSSVLCWIGGHILAETLFSLINSQNVHLHRKLPAFYEKLYQATLGKLTPLNQALQKAWFFNVIETPADQWIRVNLQRKYQRRWLAPKDLGDFMVTQVPALRCLTHKVNLNTGSQYFPVWLGPVQ